jgi:hypothetical protein
VRSEANGSMHSVLRGNQKASVSWKIYKRLAIDPLVMTDNDSCAIEMKDDDCIGEKFPQTVT